MEITIGATEFEPDQRLKSLAERKVGRLQRYLPELERADVHFALESTREVEGRRVVRVNLVLNGRVAFRAERAAADPHVALDEAVDTLKEQVLRYKGQRVDWRHAKSNRRGTESEAEETGEAEELDEEDSEAR